MPIHVRTRLAWFIAACCLFRAGLAEDSRDHTLVSWTRQVVSEEFTGEGVAAAELNHDWYVDLIAGPYWYEGPAFTVRHAYRPVKVFDPHGYSDCFFIFTEDFDGDEWLDILVYGFPGQDASWFENPRERGGSWKRHQVLAPVDNESPTYAALVYGESRRQIVCSSDGRFGYAAWTPGTAGDPWQFQPLSPAGAAGGQFTHGLGVGDVNGDDRLDLLERSGWWEQPTSINPEAPWIKHPAEFSGAGGAQMFAYDFDGDGDQDVVTSLAAHGYGLAWYEQIPGASGDDEPKFVQHLIMGTTPAENPYGLVFTELHALELADIDGDGVKDIVTGKRFWAHGPEGAPEGNRPAVLTWFRTVRSGGGGAGGVEFVPYNIDDDSGVGVELKVCDVGDDGNPDVIVANKKGVFVHRQHRLSVDAATWQRAQPVRTDERAHARQSGAAPAGAPAAGLAPADAAAAMTVPPGFHVELIAGEPDVNQPIALTYDERGRLWVLEAFTYPTRAPEGQGRDRILIFEDADGDGSFESRKVFAEGLNLASGFEVGYGGVWVGAAPYLLFIPDRDHDDVPDSAPEVLLDGWGYQDTHETLNSLTWGPDGWLYGCQGVFTHSSVGRPGNPDAERVPFDCGVWRYHPVRHVFEAFARGTSNPWGIDFDDRGQAFITACVIPHLWHVIPGARYERQAGADVNPYSYELLGTIADHRHYAGSVGEHAWWGRDQPVTHGGTDEAGGGHAHCGAMVYLGDNWPSAYRNSIFTCNIHGNRVNRDVLERHGSGYVARHGDDVIFANDPWFRGIDLATGPDGSVTLIDWYDKNACHRGNADIWDRTNGRIYRISYGKTARRTVDLRAAPDSLLVELQFFGPDWDARTARRLLAERAATGELGAAALARLRKFVAEQLPVERRLRALWALDVTGGLDLDLDFTLTRSLLLCSEPDLRAWTVRLVAERSRERYLGILDWLAQRDPSPIVRLALASGLQRLPLADRWNLASGLLSHADDARDQNLPLMIWYGIEPLVPTDPARALSLASAARIPKVARFIVRRAAADPTGLAEVLVAIAASQGDPADAASFAGILLEEAAAAVATQGEISMPAGWPELYARLSASSDAVVRGRARFLTVKFGDRTIFPALRAILADVSASAEERRQALATLAAGKDGELPLLLQGLLDEAQMRGTALTALATQDHPATAGAILSRYGALSAAERALALGTLASRSAWGLALLEAVEAGAVPRRDLSAFVARQLEQQGDPAVSAAVRRVWGEARATSDDKAAMLATYRSQLGAGALAAADRGRGRAVFAKSCAICHTMFGSGVSLGPDLTGSGRTDLDYLLENLLDPGALVGRDYQLAVVETTDGRYLSGLITSEGESSITLQLLEDPIVVPLGEVKSVTRSASSMMPEGLLAPLSDEETRDLFAYLMGASQVPLPGEVPGVDPATGRVAGALEGESMKVAACSGGSVAPQGMAGFAKAEWSAKSRLWWTSGKVGDQLALEFEVAGEGPYELLVVLTKARDYGVVKLALDDAPLGEAVDCFNSPDVITTGLLSMGTRHLHAGKHTLTVQLLSPNPKAVPANMFGLDYLFVAAGR